MRRCPCLVACRRGRAEPSMSAGSELRRTHRLCSSPTCLAARPMVLGSRLAALKHDAQPACHNPRTTPHAQKINRIAFIARATALLPCRRAAPLGRGGPPAQQQQRRHAAGPAAGGRRQVNHAPPRRAVQERRGKGRRAGERPCVPVCARVWMCGRGEGAPPARCCCTRRGWGPRACGGGQEGRSEGAAGQVGCRKLHARAGSTAVLDSACTGRSLAASAHACRTRNGAAGHHAGP